MTAAIEIDQLSKRYRLGVIGARTLREDLQRWWAKRKGAPDPIAPLEESAGGGSAGGEEVWALRRVSATLRRGEVTGIVGRNGAGKTTLLKILSRITAPTAGEVRLRGQVASLLEVGTGFHPELTGRENVFLNGAILGMTRAEVRRKLDEIVAFSGVATFLDTPVKRYSSGMRVRLAFSVAAHLAADILLVDEVLSVGDAEFQKRCLGKMTEIVSGGRTVVFVSHQLAMVTALCERVIVLDAGSIKTEGPAEEAVGAYLADQEPVTKGDVVSVEGVARDGGVGPVRFREWWLEDGSLGEGVRVRCVTACKFHLRYGTGGDANVRRVSVAATISDMVGRPLMTLWTRLRNDDFENIPSAGIFTCDVASLDLVPGVYRLGLWCSVGEELSDQLVNAGSFEVLPRDVFSSGRLPVSQHHGHTIISQQAWRCGRHAAQGRQTG